MDLKELRDKRGQIVKQMRDVLEKAKAEKRDLTAEEETRHAELFAEQDRVASQIRAEERQVELDREMAATELQRQEEERKATGGDPAYKPKGEAEYRMEAFRSFLLGRTPHPGPVADAFRALSKGDDTAGGYLSPPMEWIAQLIKAVDDMTFIRKLATVHTVSTADALGAPSLDADPADSNWTSELATGSEDSTMAFGARELHPWPLAKLLKVSKTLLRRSALPVEQIVMERLAYKFGITEEKAFLTGTGANQPLGVFTANANGISTGRDVSTGNSTTSIAADGLIEAKYKLKGQYHERAQWVFHRDAVKQVAKLKDGEGQYLWQPGLQLGQPDRLLQMAVNMSEYAPNTFTTGLYVGLLGDFTWYWIADALTMQVQRLVELYAATNQDGFIGRLECDGMPVLEEAFARVKLA